MTNNPTIDGLDRETLAFALGFKCHGHKNRTDQQADKQNALDKIRALLDAPAVERQGPDFEVARYRLKAALPGLDGRMIHRPEVVIAEAYDALQSTIAQLQARIAELESGRGEPVAWETVGVNEFGLQCRKAVTETKPAIESVWLLWGDRFTVNQRALYATPPAPVAVVLPERDLLRDKIAEAIGGDTYDCTRVWSAWGVGTMDQNDFVSLVEQEDRLYEIVDACLDATAALNGERK